MNCGGTDFVQLIFELRRATLLKKYYENYYNHQMEQK